LEAGAWALAESVPYFPPGSVHVAVVDPGVGGARDGIAVAARGSFFVGPDNGLMSQAAVAPRRVYRIENPLFRREPVCPTFHGRDIFAIAAGQLAAGRAIEEAGPLLSDMAWLAMPDVEPLGDPCGGNVVHVDHFGNLVTSLVSRRVEGRWELRCEDRRFEVAGGRTFSDVERGALLLYPGSSGRVEVAVRDGSAALLTQAKAGTRVELKRFS
jgi:hypothetical protein